MVFVEEVEKLLENLHVSDRTLGDEEFFGIKVDIFSSFKAAPLFTFGFGAFFYALTDSKAFAVSSSKFAERSAHWFKKSMRNN